MRTTCGGDEEHLPRFHASLGGGVTRAELRFGGDTDATLVQPSAAATLEWRLSSKVAVMAGGGAVLPGTLRASGRSFDVRPGWLATIGLSDRIVDGEGRSPFVLLSVSIAQSSARTALPSGTSGTAGEASSVPLRATDVRLGATIGKTLGIVTPFAAARVFGGPVFWSLDGQDLTGTDRGHYQLGVGCALTLGAGFDAFAEWDYLGERRVAAGLGWSL
jgi:hypothetical protein